MTTKSRDRTGTETSGLPLEPSAAASLPAAGPEVEVGAPGSAEDDWFDETFTAVFSSHGRAGDWDAPDHVIARSLAGAIALDFTEAVLPADGEVEIEAFAFCGSVEIRVPDGAEVVLTGTPIFGSIEHKRRGKPVARRIREMVTGETADYDDEEPEAVFRIHCTVIMGSVEVLSR